MREVEKHSIYHGDCLDLMQSIPANSVDLIYLDPPFNTKKDQSLSSKQGKKYTFGDKWRTIDEYLHFMKTRLVEMKRVLSNTGSIFVHCDTNASHYLKCLLDEIFGFECFRNEIVWSYKKWTNSSNRLQNTHQTILYYSKSDNYTFNTIYCDYSPTTNVDQILQERTRDNRNKSVYKKDSNGKTVIAKEKKGVPLSDVWEIPFLNPKAQERTGYPTQKPVLLLERIIKLASNEGDLVLDPFCGSGTTLVAAKRLNRSSIGMDTNLEAVELAKERISNPVRSDSNLLKKGKASYLTKTEKELSILQELDCTIVQRNKGIDGFLKQYYDDAPVAVKIQHDNESLEEAMVLLDSASKKKNCSYSILVRTIQGNKENECLIPGNMVLINSYDLQTKIQLSASKEKALS